MNLGTGVDSVIFGMTEDSVAHVLGPHDKVYETESGCRRLQFNGLLLELSFEPDSNGLLGWIQVHNSKAILFGCRLIGESRQRVLEVIEKESGSPSECEDYGSMVTAFYEEQWLELQFYFGRLRNINFGVLFDDADNPAWPTT